MIHSAGMKGGFDERIDLFGFVKQNFQLTRHPAVRLGFELLTPFGQTSRLHEIVKHGCLA